MNCIVCHGQEIQTKAVTETFRSGEDFVTVDVSAQVCGTCGERYYDRNTIRFLETAQQELAAGGKNFSVVGKVLHYGSGIRKSASSR